MRHVNQQDGLALMRDQPYAVFHRGTESQPCAKAKKLSPQQCLDHLIYFRERGVQRFLTK
jgi:hypothetical protein